MNWRDDVLSRFFFRNDVFISYARADATLYAVTLANELTRLDLDCYLDQFGTDPGKEVPRRLLRKVRKTRLFVLVGTSRAWESEHVKKELEEFGKTRGPIIPIIIDKPKTEIPQLIGIAPDWESRDCLTTGPSERIVQRIAKTGVPARLIGKARRLLRIAVITSVLMLLGSIAGGLYIVSTARAKANTLQVSGCP